MANHLYYGDNLNVLRETIAAASVDLIYLANMAVRPIALHRALKPAARLDLHCDRAVGPCP